MTFAPGQVIADKYEVTRALGEGGMGLVYQARHRDLGALVAIKVLRDEVMKDAEAVTRFYREAQAAALLSGEHVARVLDVARLDSGQPYLVMEFLDGADLGIILEQRGKLPVPEAVDYVVQACEALDQAHRAGIVHRDLKPANLFVVNVAGRRVVKLVDFGISRLDRPNEVRVTQTQTAFGTPLYMAPESVRSAKLADARTDLWALGVILYELLAGDPPFLGDTPTAVAVAVTVDRQKPLTLARPDVPPELEAIISWTLEKDPARRPQTAVELARALQPFRGGHHERSTQPGVPAVSVPPLAPAGTTARSMTRPSSFPSPAADTARPLTGEVAGEKKGRLALLLVGAAALLAIGGVAALLLTNAGASDATSAPAPQRESAPAAATSGAEPAVRPAPVEPTAAATPSAPPSASAAGSSVASSSAEPRPPVKSTGATSAPPIKTAPAPVPTASPKPQAPDKPGGNPLHL